MPDLGHCFRKALPGGLSQEAPADLGSQRGRAHTTRGGGGEPASGRPRTSRQTTPRAPQRGPWSRFWQAVGRQADLGNAPKRSSAGSAALAPCGGVARC